LAPDADRSAGGQPLDLGVIRERRVRDHLQVLQAGTVVELEERKRFGVAAGPDPAADEKILARRRTRQRFFDRGRLQLPSSIAAGARPPKQNWQVRDGAPERH